jgi:hypothetical protein
MPMIRETIVTTISAAGKVHVSPLGIIEYRQGWVIAPFYPSGTLDNLRAVPFAVANFTDDVRIFAGCLTGRRDWATVASDRLKVPRLEAALAHAELEVERVVEDDLRPRFHCRVVHFASHAPFLGFNRAQAAVVEGAILVSRLHLLPRETVQRGLAHLEAAVGKTGAEGEQEAWSWLVDAARAFYAGVDGGRVERLDLRPESRLTTPKGFYPQARE